MNSFLFTHQPIKLGAKNCRSLTQIQPPKRKPADPKTCRRDGWGRGGKGPCKGLISTNIQRIKNLRTLRRGWGKWGIIQDTQMRPSHIKSFIVHRPIQTRSGRPEQGMIIIISQPSPQTQRSELSNDLIPLSSRISLST